MKSNKEMLEKLGIEELNEMQLKALETIGSGQNTQLISPTGSGKTLAFLLPLIQKMNVELEEVQVLILAPSRELALQIEQVLKDLGSGLKANAIYGGRSMSQDRIDLQQPPHILVGTPGRIADHFRRETFTLDYIEYLVLDEFDKSLEIGFEADMKEILEALEELKTRVLTSTTNELQIPSFVGLGKPQVIDFSHVKTDQLKLVCVATNEKDKLLPLIELLKKLKGRSGIVFCNFKDSIERVSEEMVHKGISHTKFFGGLEQKDRERALIKFRNGTVQTLLATDLAARGIDVPALDYIIHYHLPIKGEEFTHRNGRTARMHAEGTAYVLHWKGESLPDFIEESKPEKIDLEQLDVIPEKKKVMNMRTLFISGGRRDKISKGDVAGLLMKQGQLAKEEVGVIELKPDCAFVSVVAKKVEQVISVTNNTRLKKKKVRVFEV